ncbi:MAG TPA: CpaF family protein [Solirubrobacterales bacterium]|nr:CpaF family protein [Solirubrobacterales bacterium]
MASRQRHLEQLADALRIRLIDTRREAAAAGTATQGELGEQVRELVETEAALLGEADRETLVARVLRDTVGLGPLEDLLADPSVEEVMVNGPHRVYVERGGRIEAVEARFADEEELRNAIERILAPLGRRIDELSPMVDARLADGSRVNAVIPPLAVDGPALSIRRFGAERPGPRELLELGTLTESQLARLERAVGERRSLLVSGGTGSGKTTLLGALSSFVGEDERLVTIEDAAELRLRRRHVVRLESRPAGIEGRGEVTIRALLRNALRMRPDRIVIGEVRGGEALDLLTALNTGHRGALSTVHANSPAEALGRLETLALMAGLGLPHAAIAQQVRAGIDLVVHIERRADGSRRVTEIFDVGEAAR